jgi:predicted RNA binding protein YcfA (HicA-like mRNA interferase family)
LKLPRDINADELIQLLARYGYSVTRQVGSHVRLTSNHQSSTHHITIPKHGPLKVGTFSSILAEIAAYLEMDKLDLMKELFKGD